MFKQIKTSKSNKEVVTQLTRKLGLGAENVIARIAFTYSLSQDRKLDLTEIQDSGGKEYSKSVLFGEFSEIYIGLICTHYGLYRSDKDIPKYIKIHVDDGLELIYNNHKQTNFESIDFLTNEIRT